MGKRPYCCFTLAFAAASESGLAETPGDAPNVFRADAIDADEADTDSLRHETTAPNPAKTTAINKLVIKRGRTKLAYLLCVCIYFKTSRWNSGDRTADE